MTPSTWALALVATFVSSTMYATSVQAQDLADLTGKWTLSRELSQIPKEIGFSPDWLTAGDTRGESSGSGRGRRGSASGRTPAQPIRPESADDARLIQLLTAELRTPPAQLAIVSAQSAVTISDERGRSRTFHPDGRAESLSVENLSVGVTSSRDASRLIVIYKVEQGRELRYAYSRSASPSRLTVDVQLAGRGGGDRATYIYEPARPDAGSSRVATGATPAPGASASAPGLPAQPPAQSVANQRPGAELKGLNKLGVVVEELGSQATACGLNHDALETAVTKQLTDAGFDVVRNSDEDSYVYVNVSTASVSSALCVSRYDVFFYTHATATLSYQTAPVLVQVSLLHRGGLAGGATAAHASDVLKGVREYLGQFITRIRDAGK